MIRLNFRPFLIIFAFTAVGLIFSLTAFLLAPVGIALLGVLTASIALLAIASYKEPLRLLTFVVALLFVTLTSLTFFVRLFPREEITGELRCRVTEHYGVNDGDFSATVDGITVDGVSVSGKAYVTIDGALSATCGDVLVFSGTLKPTDIITENGRVNAYAVRSDTVYYAYADLADVVIEDGRPHALEGMRLGLQTHLTSTLGNDVGGVAYGMIAGDKYMLDDDVSDSFSRAGIGHILAVSGLHVSALALLVAYLLSFLPVSKLFGKIVSTVLLFAYVLFTGFSPSAVRAFIMATVAVWAQRLGQYDSLNALCLACCVLLLVCPFFLFDAGFVMSASAVFGLVLFSRDFSAFFARLHLPKFLSEGLGATLSATLAVSPAVAHFFGAFFLYSLPVNAVMTGVLSGAFIFLLVSLPFSFAFAPILFPSGFVIQGIIWLTKAVALLPLAQITVCASAVIFFTLPLAFFASHFVRKEQKVLTVSVIAVLCAVTCVLSDYAVRENSALVAVGGGAPITVVFEGENRYLLGDLTKPDKVLTALERARVVDNEFVIYTTTLDLATAEGITALSKTLTVKEVRFAEEGNISGIFALADSALPFSGITQSDGVMDVATVNGKTVGFLYTSLGKTAFLTERDLSQATADVVSLASDVMRCKFSQAQNAPCPVLASYGGTVTVDSNHPYLYDFADGSLQLI